MDSYSIPRKLPFSKKSLPKGVIISYIVDYVIIVILFIAFWALDAIEPFHQRFSLQNYTLQYPFAEKERVPIGFLFFLVVLVPAGIIAVYTLVMDGLFSHQKQHVPARDGRRSLGGKYRFKDRLWELNCGILGLVLASGTAFVITGALKNATGKPRPDLISRCLPKAGSTDALVFGLSSSDLCTQQDNAILKDGFRSFPSGHSSSAFGGLFYLSLYLAGKLHVLDNRGEVWKTFVVLAPTLGAALIAVSRIMDARHHPFDVISGSLLGTLTAFVAYRQYFPPLRESWHKGRAFPIRSWGTEPLGPESKHEEREVARDQGVEPLRAAAIHDEEEASRNASGPPASPMPRPRENVFRQQISEAERVRQQEYEAQRSGPSANYTIASNTRNPSSQFSKAGSRRGRAANEDGYWSSSSEEHEGDEPRYGQQRKYALTDIHGPGHDLEDFTYTAYSPQTHPSNATADASHLPPVSVPPPGGLVSGQQHHEHLGA